MHIAQAQTIKDWTPQQLTDFIKQTIQQEPGMLPASQRVTTLQVDGELYLRGVRQTGTPAA